MPRVETAKESGRVFLDVSVEIPSGVTRYHGKAVYRARQAPEDFGQEHADGFECQQVGQRDFAVEVGRCLSDSDGVAANIPHVSYKRPDDLYVDVRPSLLVERAELLVASKGVFDSERELLV